MGCGAFDLAGGFHAPLALGEVPADRPWRGIGRGDGPGKAAQHRLVELRPELQQRQGAIEAHIQALVPGVVQALQHPESADGVFATAGTPEAAAAAEVVELVEERHPQRLGQITALQHRLLPGLDLLAPAAPVPQTFGGDGGGVLAAGAEEVGVAPQGTGAGGEGRDRQVPADHHRDLDALAGLQAAAHRQGRADGLGCSTAAVVIALGDRAIAAEAAPEIRAVALGIPAAAALDAHAGLLLRRDAPLPFPFGDRGGDITP